MRLIIDANVLLSGVFVPGSFSGSLLEDIRSGKIMGYLTENTIDEAKNVIARVRKKVGVDLMPAFDSYIHFSPFIMLPRVRRFEAVIYEKIKGAEDQALLAASIKTGFDICTNDIGDFRYASEYGVKIHKPIDVSGAGGDALKCIFPANLAMPSQGSYYLEAEADWRVLIDNDTEERLYPIIDTEGIGGLYFTSKGKLRFTVDNGPTVDLQLGPIPEKKTPMKICVTYQHDKGVALYNEYRGKRARLTETWMPSPSPHKGTTLYGGRIGKMPIVANLGLCASYPQMLNEKTVNNIMSGKTPPYPLDRLGLEDAIIMFYL